MPRLLVFAPCEKALVGDDNSSSLIVLLEVVKATLAVDSLDDIPPNTRVPFRWYIYALWRRESDADVGLFEQRIQLIMPDEQRAFEQIMEFVIEPEHQRVRTIGQVAGFPIPTRPGDGRLKIAVRKKYAGTEWQEAGEYPIVIELTAAGKPQEE